MSAMSMIRLSSTLPAQLLRPVGGVNNLLVVKMSPSSSSAATPSEAYVAKNKKLGRPVSPWIIYKIQLTSFLSITHRGTGLGLSALLYAMGINALVNQNTNWAQILATINATVPSSLLLMVKVAAASAVGYHTINGVRHLAWDIGYGFTLRDLYTSGYVVLALTALIAVASIYYA